MSAGQHSEAASAANAAAGLPADGLRATRRLQERFAGALMPNYGMPAGPRPGVPRVGRRRAGVPRPHCRDRRVLARSRPPGDHRGRQPSGGVDRAHEQPVPARARGRTRRAAARPDRCRRHCGGQGLLHQLWHRGERGGDQAHAPIPRRRHRHRQPRAHLCGCRGRGFSRAHHGRARSDRQGADTRAVRALRRAGDVRAIW